MNSNSVTVIARIQVQPGSEEKVQALLTSLVAPTRQEAGCLNYDLHRSTENPSEFLFHENWSSRADLERHLQTPHLQSVIAQVIPLAAEPPQVTLWNRIA